MQTFTSVLVVAPTGAAGMVICEALSQVRDRFHRVAAFKNTSRPQDPAKAKTYEAFEKLGIEIVSGTYEDVAAFKGFEVVIMTLGNHGMYLQPQIIDTAIAAGVSHFYPSEFGADILVGDNWNQRYYKYKVEAREHLAKRAAEVDGLGWTFITIGRFSEWCAIKHFGVDNAAHTAQIFGNAQGRQSLLGVKDVGAYVARTLLDPVGPEPKDRQRTFRFHCGVYTWKHIFDTLAAITGKPYDVTYLPFELAKEHERVAKEAGDIDRELEASHQLIQGSEGTLLPEPTDNRRYPEIKPEPMEEGLRKAFHDPEKKRALGLLVSG